MSEPNPIRPALSEHLARSLREEDFPQPTWHPIRERKQDDSTVAGCVYSYRFEDVPTPLGLAHLMRVIEESDWPLVFDAACVFQAAAESSPALARRFAELATLMVDAGCVRPGGAVEGVSVAEDLERLLTATALDPLDALDPEDHTPLEEILSMAQARYERREGDVNRLAVVIRRLETELSPSGASAGCDAVAMTLQQYESLLDELQSARDQIDHLTAKVRTTMERLRHSAKNPPT